ncbi:MAG: hypothetical protein LH650_06230 [Chloroflexi bacterium]|nr:hypothetical protein [Chloroflexota bacterium]
MHNTGTRRLRQSVLAIVTVALCVAGSAAALAQETSPAASVPASPPASPAASANTNGWSPVRFVGGDPEIMTFTSDCAIPGIGTFHLVGSGPLGEGQMDVTLTTYDEANLWFEGHALGQVDGTNATWVVDEAVFMAYDTSQGMWYLKGTWMNQVPIEPCAPAPSAAP